MKKILAPIDFSSVSINAARYAANMAAYLHLPLQLIHITVLPMSYGPTGSIEATIIDDNTAPAERLHQLAKMLQDELKGQVDIETILRTGSPVYEIKSYCDHQSPFAVIIGTHGDSEITRFLLGSTTLGLIKECECPVIVVPNDFVFNAAKKVGLASDFQHVSTTTPSEDIHEIIRSFGANLEILHVENKQEELADIAEAKRELGVIFTVENPKIRVLKSVLTEETLLDYTAEESFDLLIVVPKKHNWLEMILKRQHTSNIALHAKVPVMMMKNH